MFKPAAIAGVAILTVVLAGVGMGGVTSSMLTGPGSSPSAHAVADIPANYFILYRQAAATCPGLDWSIPAAIGKVESDHGRSPLPGVRSGANYAGARGPMQFLSSTFAEVAAQHSLPHARSQGPSPYNPRDAIYATVALLCDAGGRHGHNVKGAIFAYNHADWYVARVLDVAASYRQSAARSSGTAALLAINYAEGQLGLPYVWGGDGPEAGDIGFDCSGLTRAAYAAAGVSLPRTAQRQFEVGPLIPGESQLTPGDLVFYGRTPAVIHHVGLYIGDGQMIAAPGRGKKIRVEPYRYAGDDYAGATRPAT